VLDDGTQLPLAQPLDLPEGTAVTYGVRPQTITLDPNGMPAEVVLVEPTGEVVEATLSFAGHDIVAVLPEDAALEPGDKVGLHIHAERTFVFDAQTGERLA
jgi:multiple sugar transport system ATP-binding protein